MTASLANFQNGPFGSDLDGFVYPQFLFDPQRAPTTNDIKPAGTRWLDNSVNPKVLYETTGAGLWYSQAGAGMILTSLTVNGPTTLIGTTNINSTGTAATNIGNATGNTTVTGNETVTGSITSTLGNITATNGNIVKGTAGNKDIYSSVATTTAAGANSAGTVTLVAGTATIATTAVTANSIIRLYRQSIGATGAAALGELTIGTKTAGTSFVINAVEVTAANAVQTTDVSVVAWEIVN